MEDETSFAKTYPKWSVFLAITQKCKKKLIQSIEVDILGKMGFEYMGFGFKDSPIFSN